MEFTDEALTAIAKKSMERKTGARGLRAIMEETMMDLMFVIPSDNAIAKCVITEEAVNKTGEPEIIYRSDAVNPVHTTGKHRRNSNNSGEIA